MFDNPGYYIIALAGVLFLIMKIKDYLERRDVKYFKRIFQWLYLAIVLLVGAFLLGIAPLIIAVFQHPSAGFKFIGFLVIFLGSLISIYFIGEKIDESDMRQREKKILKFVVYALYFLFLYFLFIIADKAGIEFSSDVV